MLTIPMCNKTALLWNDSTHFLDNQYLISLLPYLHFQITKLSFLLIDSVHMCLRLCTRLRHIVECGVNI